MVGMFNLIIANRKATQIFLAVNFAIIVTWLVVFNRHPTDQEVRKDHVSSSTTVGIDGHDAYWTNNMKAIESMSVEEMYRYLRWTNSTSCHNAVDFGFNVGNFNGVTAIDGHRAVCLDKHISPAVDDCLVYSFGINNEWAFDEAMAKFGCQVYSFDPSMNVREHNRSKFIHFFDLGLDGENRLHPTKGWQMKTVSSVFEMLASRHGAWALIDVLKIDIENSEWDAIPQMLHSGFLVDKVKQLAAEIHFEADDALEVLRHRVQILRNLEGEGFVRFSSRPNPFFDVPLQVSRYKHGPIALDLAWYNSRYYPSVV
ncbi:methyltransferase-like protein 24 [Daphnia magna]|nr:methyltransferase-like protein 24 [Daphnia magna]